MDNQVCITTDNGVNIVRAIGQLEIPCFGHNLDLAVMKAMKKDSCISRALGLARNIVSAVSYNWK